MSSRRLSTTGLLLIASILAISRVEMTTAFVTTSTITTSSSTFSITALQAKKKKKSQTGRGFGKESIAVNKPKALDKVTEDLNVRAGEGISQQLHKQDAPFLTSVANGSNAIPTMDENIPVEERTKALLRDKYGLRTREEQQAEEERQRQAAEQRQKLEQWKEQVERGEDFDIIQALPEPGLVFVDRFLKAGVAICTTLFILAGLGITVEAGSKATNNPLPENIDAFITNVVEPNFTPGLLVLLGFSVSLGAFAALQLGSASSTYREDR